jgi:hypothetical protein
LEESLSADPNSWIDAAIEDLRHTLSEKNHDYKIDGEFSNFEYAAELSGSDVLGVMMTQIGIKLGRLKGLPEEVYNEPKIDTYKDLAGYAVILYAYVMSQYTPVIDLEF